MSFDALLNNPINTLGCFVTIFFLALLFRKPLADLIGRLSKANFPKGSIEFDKDDKGLSSLAEKGEEAAETLGAIAEQAKNIFHQGKPYDDYGDAFQDLERRIKDRINDDLKDNIENPKVTLKLIAVAMTFSWKFIVGKIPKILEQYSTAHLDIEVLFIDPQYLESLGLSRYEVNWVEEGRQRISQCQDFIEQCQEQFQGRISFTAKIYKNLPHWHGWLINDEYLFLGRTNWIFPSEHPKLLVGQNKYRYFDQRNIEGSERIQLFLSWQRYYYGFASTLICTTSQKPNLLSSNETPKLKK